MKKERKILSTIAIALAIAVAIPVAPVSATELIESNNEATLTDAMESANVDTSIDLEETEDELLRVDGAVSLKDAISVNVNSRNYNKYRNKYVYQKLSASEKIFYDGLDKVAYKYLTTNVDVLWGHGFAYLDSVSYKGISIQRAMEIAEIFEYQNPQYYFLSGSNSYNSKKQEFNLGMYGEFSNGSNRADSTERFFTNVDIVVNRVKKENGDYNRAKAAHDEICKLASTDGVVREYVTSAWGVFMCSYAIGHGYSKAFSMVANACGIETVGDSNNGEDASRKWNRSYVDGNWYYVDCVWDDMENNYSCFLVGNNTVASLGYGFEHITGEQLNGLLPNCPFDYDPNNPRVGEKPLTDVLSEVGIFVAKADRESFFAGATTDINEKSNLEYCWYVSADNGSNWTLLKGWTLNDEWLAWSPTKFGEYDILVRVRERGASDFFESHTEYSYHPSIKGVCQMPYAGGGYLIGVESYDNPQQSLQYEMSILDCTLLAQGKDAWTYTTGKCKVDSGNSLWIVWQPKYGYYWTLFRVYDRNNNLLDEVCYGFVNAY